MNAAELWPELENPQVGPGIVRRRVRDDSDRNLFLGVRHPALERMLIINVPEEVAAGMAEPPTTTSLKTVFEPGPEAGTVDIRICLVIPEMARVFDPFVEDVIAAASAQATDAGAVDALLTRFAYWRRLLA